MVTGYGTTAGAAISSHMDIDKVIAKILILSLDTEIEYLLDNSTQFDFT